MIIGGIMMMAIPRMSPRPTDPKKVFSDITRSVKEIRNRARLYNSSYRLAIRLDEDEQAYWVEKSNQITLVNKAILDEEREKAKSNFKNDKEEATPTSGFQADTSFFKTEQLLPQGFTFKLVESGSRNDSYTEGMAYIHFFPQGFIEPSIIQLQDTKNNVWTIYFNSLTGQSTVIPDEKTLLDLNR